MIYTEQIAQLNEVWETQVPEARSALDEMGPALIVEEIAAPHQFVFAEIGNLCEAVRQAISGEIKDADAFKNAVMVSLQEDHVSSASEIAKNINEQILSKISLALGKTAWSIKAPFANAIPTLSPAAFVPVKSSFSTSLSPANASSPTDEKNLRALFRISVGTNYTEDALREKFESLPAGLRQAIASVDTANAVQAIAKRYILHVDQMGALSSETGLVLLGLTHPRDFTRNLAARLRVSEPRALEIARSVSEAVLVKVKEGLRGLHEEAKSVERKTQSEEKKTESETPKKLNVLAAQAQTKPETNPSRDEVLRGIENPKEMVGPTGWRPKENDTNIRMSTNDTNKEKTIFVPKLHASLPMPPLLIPEQQKSVLDEKLSQTVSLPHEEKRYSVDPYREPLN